MTPQSECDESGNEWYICRSETCSDNGGTCKISIPHGYAAPTGCVNPEEEIDDCRWVNCTRSRPAPSPDHIKKAIDKLEYSLKADPHEEIDCHIREAVTLLRTGGDDKKPGCFGAIGKPGKRKDPDCPCEWSERCKQSQEDY